MVEMNRRGIGGVVGMVLIILLTIIAVSVFIGSYVRNIKQTTANDAALCPGIEVFLKSCVLFPAGTALPGGEVLSSDGLHFIVERGVGDEPIASLRFIVTDNMETDHTGVPVPLGIGGITTDYSNFVAHSTVESAVTQITYTPDVATVSAVVGESLTVCNPTAQPIKCTWPNLTPVVP